MAAFTILAVANTGFGSAIVGERESSIIIGGCAGSEADTNGGAPCYTKCDANHGCPAPTPDNLYPSWCEGIANNDKCKDCDDSTHRCDDCESSNGCGVKRKYYSGTPSICKSMGSYSMCTNGWCDPSDSFCPKVCKMTSIVIGG